MDVETLLRDTLAHQADDAPRAGDDLFDRAVRARSARRRHLAGSAGVAVVVSALVVGLAVVSRQQGADVAAPAAVAGASGPVDGVAAGDGTEAVAGSDPAPSVVAPAPPVADQQAQMAEELGIADPPAVDVVRLVTPVQRERLVADCMGARGWGDPAGAETTTIDVTTGFLSASADGGGYTVPAGEQGRFDLDSYVCMASYPIDPAYVEDSGNPYVDSPLVVAAGRGEQLAGYEPAVVVSSMTENWDGTDLPSVSAGWVGEDYLAITTWGSSSCPAVPVSWTVEGGAWTVTTGPLSPDADVCTADASPTTVVLELPRGIDPAADLILTVDGLPLTLPAAR